MWTLLFESILLLLLFLYVPGILFLRGLGLRKSRALVYAPLFTIVGYSLLAIIYSKVGLVSNWVSLVAPLTALGGTSFLIGLFLRQRNNSHSPKASLTQYKGAASLALYCVVAIATTTLLYILPLGSADAFICAFDIAHHMAVPRVFIETGNWSTLSVTLFPGEAGSFYPSVNSLCAALIISALDVPVTLAINATNIVFTSLVFPLGMWLFMGKVFGWKDFRTYLGAFCCMLFAAFPWELFTRSAPTLYAFFVGICIVPHAMALLMDCLEPWQEKRSPLRSYPNTSRNTSICSRTVIFFVALTAIALSHPSAFFSYILFAIAYIAYVLFTRTASLSRGKRIAIVVLWLLFCLVLWVLLNKAPFMSSTVNYEYPAKAKVLGGVARIVLMWAPHVGVQYILGFVVGIGVLACLFDKKRRWLLFPFLLTVFITYFSIISSPGAFKSMLSGFWYNHHVRLMSTIAVFAMPLAAQGFASIAIAAELIAKKTSKSQALKSIQQKLNNTASITKLGTTITVIAIVAIAIIPVPLPRQTTLYGYERKMENFNNPSYGTSFLTQEERDFLQTVSSTIGNEGVIFNAPHDGSAYAYALSGINIVNRSFHETDDYAIRLLASDINSIATNKEVARIAKDMNIEYVIQLDAPTSEKRTLYRPSVRNDSWKGVLEIREDTPGFELVLAEGDMRLYRIIYPGTP